MFFKFKEQRRSNQRRIYEQIPTQNSKSTEAWSRYQTDVEIKPPPELRPEEEHKEGFVTQEYDTPQEKEYNPHTVWGIPRATFRGLVIGISCLIGATLFVYLKPDAITEDK